MLVLESCVFGGSGSDESGSMLILDEGYVENARLEGNLEESDECFWGTENAAIGLTES